MNNKDLEDTIISFSLGVFCIFIALATLYLTYN